MKKVTSFLFLFLIVASVPAVKPCWKCCLVDRRFGICGGPDYGTSANGTIRMGVTLELDYDLPSAFHTLGRRYETGEIWYSNQGIEIIVYSVDINKEKAAQCYLKAYQRGVEMGCEYLERYKESYKRLTGKEPSLTQECGQLVFDELVSTGGAGTSC